MILQGERLRREKKLVKDIAEFLLLSQIPSFVNFLFLLKLVFKQLFTFIHGGTLV